jgi:hypothetical protein
MSKIEKMIQASKEKSSGKEATPEEVSKVMGIFYPGQAKRKDGEVPRYAEVGQLPNVHEILKKI